MSLQKQLENIDHRISVDAAVDMVTSFRDRLPSILQPSFTGALPYAETFNRNVFEELLALENCIAVRAYLGLDDQQQIRLILVGVNDDGEDILPPEEISNSGEDSGLGAALFEYGQRCPPVCGTQGPLNPPV